MHKFLLLLFFFSINLGISFSQKNRFESFFKEIDSLKDSGVKIAKLQQLKKNNSLNKKEKILFYKLIIPETIEIQKFDLSLQYSFEALRFANSINNDSLRGVYYMQIGSSYYYVQDKKKAIEYYEKAIIYSKKTHNWNFEAMTLNNIGAISIEEENYEKAEKVLKKSLAIFKEHKILDSKGLLPQRLLATLYTYMKRYDEAKSIYVDIISKSKEIKDTSIICFSLVYYARLLSDEGNNQSALKSAEEALKIQRIQNNKNTLVVVLTILSSISDSIGKYKEAAHYNREIILLNRSIFKDNLKNAVAETEVKYKTAEIKKQKELAEAKTLAEERRNELYVFSFVGITLLLIIVFLVFYLKSQAKRKKMELALQRKHLEAVIEAQEKEKTRIARDLHDGICQKFAATKMKFSYISEGLLDNIPGISKNYNDCINLLDEATNELRSIAHEIMPPSLKELGLAEALKNLSDQTFNKQIIYSFEVFGKIERLNPSEEINMYRISQELFANVIKHSKATQVAVQLIFSTKQVILMVEDNGVGFVKNERTGMGLGNIYLRTEIIKAKFNIEPSEEGGTLATVKLIFENLN